MGGITNSFASAFRDFETEGVPATGDHEPVKSEIRAIGPAIETEIADVRADSTAYTNDAKTLLQQSIAAVAAGLATLSKPTRAALDADLAHAADTVALVYADPTDANNDLYVKVGASGAGSWTRTTVLHGMFAYIFSLGNQEVIGSKILRVFDQAGRMIFDLDIDSLAGGKFYVPVELLADSLPLATLKGGYLDDSASDVTGSAFRVLSPDGSRVLFDIPVNYPSRPIRAVVDRSRFTDAFAGASGGGYLLEGEFDAQGDQQLYARNLLSGARHAITSAGHATAPTVDGDNALWIDTATELAMWRPLNASDIARGVRPTRALSVFGDSTGQGLEVGLAGTSGYQVTPDGRRVWGTSVGSQRTKAIAARAGVPGVIKISFPGGSIAAAGSTACAVDYDFHVGAGGPTVTGACRVVVPTPSGPLEGVLQRTWSGAAAVWAFVRSVAGAAEAVGVGPLDLVIAGGMLYGSTDPATALAQPLVEQWRSGPFIVRTGRNDIGAGGYDQAQTVALIQSLLARQTSYYRAGIAFGVMQTYAWVPVAYGGVFAGTDAQAKALFDADLAFNAALLAAVGADNYADIMEAHADAGHTATVTLLGTLYDYVTPAALADTTHENATGQATAAALVNNWLTARGI